MAAMSGSKTLTHGIGLIRVRFFATYDNLNMTTLTRKSAYHE